MSNYARYRDWHKWIGLILLLPLAVIATTGFLWNHEKTLGIKRMEPAASPHATAGQENAAAATESCLKATPGMWNDHAAAIEAALAAAQQEWGDQVPLERIELKHEPGQGLVVKVKIPENAALRPEEIVWSVSAAQVVERKGDPHAGTDWARVVHDLHTGKFFSRQYGFLWSDSSALAILALGLTGVVLYLIPVLKKSAKRKKSGRRPVPPSDGPVPAKAMRPMPVGIADGQEH